MEIKPIRTDADHAAALAAISVLMGPDPKLGTPEGDRLDVLATLVQVYETRQYPIEPADPVEAIKFRMEWATAHYCGLAKNTNWLLVTCGLANLCMARRRLLAGV